MSNNAELHILPDEEQSDSNFVSQLLNLQLLYLSIGQKDEAQSQFFTLCAMRGVTLHFASDSENPLEIDEPLIGFEDTFGLSWEEDDLAKLSDMEDLEEGIDSKKVFDLLQAIVEDWDLFPDELFDAGVRVTIDGASIGAEKEFELASILPGLEIMDVAGYLETFCNIHGPCLNYVGVDEELKAYIVHLGNTKFHAVIMAPLRPAFKPFELVIDLFDAQDPEHKTNPLRLPYSFKTMEAALIAIAKEVNNA